MSHFDNFETPESVFGMGAVLGHPSLDIGDFLWDCPILTVLSQSWLRDEIFLGSPMSNLDPGDRDRDLKIPKKSSKPRKIPGIGIGIWKPRKNPKKIPSAKSQKSRNPGDRDQDLKISKKIRENPEKSRVENLVNPKTPEIGIFSRGMGFLLL